MPRLEAPEKDRSALDINLKGEPPDPATFEGPLNAFIGLHGTAVASNTATQTKKNYDELHPAPPPPAPETPKPGIEQPAPIAVSPISAGTPIDDRRGVIDPEIARRVHPKRPPRYK